jgi:alpha-tubulin suppressor-like RCC1 family protein
MGAFVALKADGSLSAWGDPNNGGKKAPIDKSYTKVYSTFRAFAALKSDGSIVAWGNPKYGGTKAFKNNSSKDKDYTKISSNGYAFAFLPQATMIPSALRAAKAWLFA